MQDCESKLTGIMVEKANQDEVVVTIIFLMMDIGRGTFPLQSLHLGCDSTSGGEDKLYYW